MRAKIAKTPESSDFTSAQDRIADLKSADEVSTPDAQVNRMEHGERAGWLAPIPLEPKRQAVRAKQTVRRASNKGCLSMGLGDYLQLLDWTGRQIRKDKVGAISVEYVPTSAGSGDPLTTRPAHSSLETHAQQGLQCLDVGGLR